MSDTLKALKIENAKLRNALLFYADPDTYFAWAFFSDPPAGDWGKDFQDLGVHGTKPGKRARKALRLDMKP